MKRRRRGQGHMGNRERGKEGEREGGRANQPVNDLHTSSMSSSDSSSLYTGVTSLNRGL